MRILVCPADRGGCGYYRMIWPALALAAEGHNVRVMGEGETFVGHYMYEGGPLHHLDPVDADVVVLQRCLHRETVETIQGLQLQGIAVVVEIDDDFSRIDPDNIAHSACDPKNSPDRNWHWLREASRIADLVTVSTPALARTFAPHGRVAVLENCVPSRYLDEPAKRALSGQVGPVKVGWAGSVATHPGDLDVCGTSLARLVRDFYVVGTGQGVQDALGLAEKPKTCGWVELDDYPNRVAQLDIGIVPLKMSGFNRAKSWLKGLEMAAVGVPFVASRTAEYKRLHGLGAGRLAAGAQDWHRELSRLLDNPNLRADLVASGRAVAKEWTVEGNAYRWLQAWTEARALRVAA